MFRVQCGCSISNRCLFGGSAVSFRHSILLTILCCGHHLVPSPSNQSHTLDQHRHLQSPLPALHSPPSFSLFRASLVRNQLPFSSLTKSRPLTRLGNRSSPSLPTILPAQTRSRALRDDQHSSITHRCYPLSSGPQQQHIRITSTPH